MKPNKLIKWALHGLCSRIPRQPFPSFMFSSQTPSSSFQIQIPDICAYFITSKKKKGKKNLPFDLALSDAKKKGSGIKIRVL